MGIRDERNGNPLIVPRTYTLARVPNIFSTSNGAFSATTSLDSIPSSFTLNLIFVIFMTVRTGHLSYQAAEFRKAVYANVIEFSNVRQP